MKRLVIISISFLLLTSCAIHQGTVSSSSIGRNVKYEDIAIGVSQINKYFGLGGLSQDALVLEAKRNMIKSRPLKTNEEYLNFTVDLKRTYLFFYNQTKVTVSADVVRYTNDSITELYSETYKNKLLGKSIINDLFSIGDSILYDNFKDGTIIAFESDKEVRILYKSNRNKIRTKKALINDIYTKCKSYKGYKIGDRYIYSVIVSNNEEQKTSGKILAFGLNALIIRNNSKEIQILNYNK
jgi:hypothetical protein